MWTWNIINNLDTSQCDHLNYCEWGCWNCSFVSYKRDVNFSIDEVKKNTSNVILKVNNRDVSPVWYASRVARTIFTAYEDVCEVSFRDIESYVLYLFLFDKYLISIRDRKESLFTREVINYLTEKINRYFHIGGEE